MANGIGLQQVQKLQQKLSPQQIQIIKMLELPSLELEERINQELVENPALEEGASVDNIEEEEFDQSNMDEQPDGEFEKIDWETYFPDDETPAYQRNANNTSPDDEVKQTQYSATDTFHDHLIAQLGEFDLSNDTYQLCQYIIGNIDDDGYLSRGVEQMVDDLAFSGITTTDAQMSQALSIVQELEPCGVAARNLQECLLLQIKRTPSSPTILTAQRVLDQCFDEFMRRQFDKIMRKLSLSEEEMKSATAKIQLLNPKPGGAWATSSLGINNAITPDFIVTNTDGQLTVSLSNQNIPSLRVSAEYITMLENYRKSSPKNQTREQLAALQFAKEKIDSARWFIDAIKQRNETLLTTMNAIVAFQKNYFETGDEAQLKPMILKDIATTTGFDIATISRVTNSKYAETEFGIFSLKSFFSGTMRTESGDEVSSKEVKRILKESVMAEDKRKPLTDDEIAEILRAKGYVMARRTVTKYRERLGIPVARLRKLI